MSEPEPVPVPSEPEPIPVPSESNLHIPDLSCVQRIDVSPSKDVHIYDGKILNPPLVPVYSEGEKTCLFSKLKSKLSREASHMIEIIMKGGGNHDAINNLNSSDLLYHLVINNKPDSDMYQNLNEQLADMYRLGQCPQGRVIRLVSLVNAFL